MSDSHDISCLLYIIHSLFFRYYQEFAPLGTAGGIYHFRDQIQRGNPEAFFVLNSDVCGDFPLTEMLRFHRDNRRGDHYQHREQYTMLGTEVCVYGVVSCLER